MSNFDLFVIAICLVGFGLVGMLIGYTTGHRDGYEEGFEIGHLHE
jgi:hypothetical protein